MAKLGAQIGGGTNTNMHVLFAGKRESSMRDSLAVEKHYRVKELADLWGFSENTIIKLFGNEDGVLRLESPTGKRKYATLSIPESVAIRVHERLGNQALKAASARRNPLRVIHLRDLDARMTKQPPAPAADSTSVSVSTCVATRIRPAPSANRMPNSLCRPTERASRRFATLAHTISRTTNETASRMVSGARSNSFTPLCPS